MSTHPQTVAEFLAMQSVYEARRRWLHRALRVVGGMLAKVDVFGLEHVPAQGGALLIMNHTSAIDPIVITYAVTHRHVITMAKAETRHNPLFNLVIHLWGNFTVNRGAVDRFALNSTVELLKAQQLLMLAPEGTRNPQGLQEAKDGIVYIAHKANVPIIPVAVTNAQGWKQQLSRLRRIRPRVDFGRPFKFVFPSEARLSKKQRAEMTREAMYQLARTIPESSAALRGVYADVENATTNYLAFL